MRGHKLVIDSSEDGHIEICYDNLSLEEIESRIQAYEKKYAKPFPEFVAQHCGCCAGRIERRDCIDWECLIAERSERLGLAPAQP